MSSTKPFEKSVAYVVGIAHYDKDIPTLKTPINDAKLVAETLKEQGFEVTLETDLTGDGLRTLLKRIEQECLTESMRVVVYYAGHGSQEDSKQGLKGYLLPSDAVSQDTTTYIPMQMLADVMNSLNARHVLLVLDCCFAGTFNFSNTRDALTIPQKNDGLSRQYYNVFTQYPSKKVICSTSSKGKAFDTIEWQDTNSPFAKEFVHGIKGEADKGDGDKLVTIPELHAHLKNTLTPKTYKAGMLQPPKMGSLNGDAEGEFIFFTKAFSSALLTEEDYDNPYQGLKSYEPKNAAVFFGRQKAIEELTKKVNEHRFVIVTGASGTGKSSLVKAGLLPKMADKKYVIIRPGKNPMASLPTHTDWDILVIDQWEEIVTQAQNEADITQFFQQIKTWTQNGKQIIGTVRADFEPQSYDKILEKEWQKGRFLVPAFTPEEYHDIIVLPARRVACTFEESSLINEIKEEVNGEPGPLPLLSFLMQEIFVKVKKESAKLWQIKRRHYEELGGLSGALKKRADQVYEDLKNTEGGQDMMRRIMLRMVSFSAGELASKRVYLEDLDFGDKATVDKVVTALNDARLIRLNRMETGKNTYPDEGRTEGVDKNQDNDTRAYLEPAHDALVRSWKRLWDWVKELKEENLLLFNKVATATGDYQKNASSKKYLWQSDARLDQALELVKADNPMNLDERAFIENSRIRRRNSSWILRGWVTAAFLVLGVITWWALQQRGIANVKTKEALTEKQEPKIAQK